MFRNKVCPDKRHEFRKFRLWATKISVKSFLCKLFLKRFLSRNAKKYLLQLAKLAKTNHSWSERCLKFVLDICFSMNNKLWKLLSPPSHMKFLPGVKLPLWNHPCRDEISPPGDFTGVKFHPGNNSVCFQRVTAINFQPSLIVCTMLYNVNRFPPSVEMKK